MTKDLNVFIMMFIVLLSSCQHYDKETFTWNHNLDYETNKNQEYDFYRIKYSWKPIIYDLHYAKLDSIVNVANQNASIGVATCIIGPKIKDVDYINRRYTKIDEMVYIVKYGKAQCMGNYSRPPCFDIELLSDIPECIIEEYTWEIALGNFLSIVYLRIGVELVPLFSKVSHELYE